MEYRLREVNFNHEELMRLNESQKITLRNYYFDQLIHGTILSEEEAAYAQNYLSISANANSFAILYCNVYLDTLGLNNDPQGMINILSLIMRMLFPISFPVILYIPISCRVPEIVFILFYYMTGKNWTRSKIYFHMFILHYCKNTISGFMVD